jgi:hypothetical protein
VACLGSSRRRGGASGLVEDQLKYSCAKQAPLFGAGLRSGLSGSYIEVSGGLA